MINLSKNEFLRHKKNKKVFPMFYEVNADELTPIGIYYNLRGRNKFLLESVYSEREIGRYSFIGVEPYANMRSHGEEVLFNDGKSTHAMKGRILDYVKLYISQEYEAAGLSIPFTGGGIGYKGFERSVP